MIPEYWKQATNELSMNDDVLGRLIIGFKGAILCSHGNAFATLARSIVSQQISVKAAENIWQKIISNLTEITPKKIYCTEEKLLRSFGLSQRKADYLKNLSFHFIKNDLNESNWHKMDDEALILELTRVRGI